VDEITLLVFASKLLEICNLHKGNTIYSIIAELDRKPAQFHRIFSNALINHPIIIEVATDVMGNEEIKTRNIDELRKKYATKIASLEKEHSKLKNLDSPYARVLKNEIYCYKRILEDAEYFLKSLEEVLPFVGEEVLDIRTDKIAAYLALMSHVYLVSYTYPPQPFFPYSASACQHIEFCKKVDYFDFKLMFSGEDTNKATEFRRAISRNEKAWSKEVDPNLEEDPAIRKRLEVDFGKPFNPHSMIKAMIERLGELVPSIRYEAVQRTIRDYLANLGCKEIVHSDRERWFLVNLEKEIEETIIGMR
jgi:hypothetical protein